MYNFSSNYLSQIHSILKQELGLTYNLEAIFTYRTNDGKSMMDIITKITGHTYFETAEAFVDIENQLLRLREKFNLVQINNLQSRLFGAWEIRSVSKSLQRRFAWIS